MIRLLKNTPVRALMIALEQEGFQYKRPREANESIVTQMGVV
jgi:hypothetical protein